LLKNRSETLVTIQPVQQDYICVIKQKENDRINQEFIGFRP
jgi:hypothetical protein